MLKLIATLHNRKRGRLYSTDTWNNIPTSGLRLRKIHRALEFTESSWIKDYIDFKTEKAKSRNTEFEKNLYKLLNISVFGKTTENVHRQVKVSLITAKELNMLASNPSYQNVTKP